MNQLRERGEKLTRAELRAANDSNAVLNSAWNGARNKTVSFNLILEAQSDHPLTLDRTCDILDPHLIISPKAIDRRSLRHR